MPFTNYTDLQAAAVDWMTRTGQAAKAPDWIALAEARLNRELSPIETDEALVGVVSSRAVDISALSIVKPIALWIAPAGGGDEVLVQPQSAGTMAYLESTGLPRQWAMDGQANINFDRPCDQAYAFRFRYVERFDLATTATNWLLTDHPDLYLAATLMWGAGYNEDWSNGATWKAVLDEGMVSVRSLIAQNRRGTLRVDPALSQVGRWRRSYSDLVNNG